MHQRTARRSRRAAAAASAALLASSLAAAPALADIEQTPEDEDSAAITRYAGADRFETSADFASEGVGAARNAIVTTGLNFPDALAGAYLSGTATGPVILTAPDRLVDEARDAVAALADANDDFENVYVLGGAAAVSDDVLTALEAIDGVDEVIRISGRDRFETAATVALTVPGEDRPDICQADYLSPCLPVVDDLNCRDVGQVVVLRESGVDPYDLDSDDNGTGCEGQDNAAADQVEGIDDEDEKVAILATGANFPDALVAGVMSRAGSAPILLTLPDQLPESTVNALRGLEIDRVVIAGGAAVVSDGVMMAVDDIVDSVERVSGADRFATAVAFADFIDANYPAFAADGAVGLARADTFPDALSMAPFAGGPGAFPILLTQQDALNDTTQPAIEARAAAGGRVYIAGGTAAVSDAAAQAAADAAFAEGDQGDGLDTDDSDGDNSLRTAATAGGAIELAENETYTLSLGDLEISEDTTITGNGATIDAEGTSRVFDVSSGATLTLDDVNITGGDTEDDDGREGFGGGIRVEEGSLVMTGGSVEGNTAAKAGGGVEVNGGQSATFTDVDFTNNTTDGNGATAANGGAIHSTGTVTVTGGVVRGNVAAQEGGGFWQGAGTMTVEGTEFYANQARGGFTAGPPVEIKGGGALFVIDGTLDVTDAVIGASGEGNQAQTGSGSGGAILNHDGTLNLTTSTVSFNSANRAGGAIEVWYTEADTATSTTIVGSLFRGNAALGGADGDGPDDGPGNGGVVHVSGPANVDIETSFFTFNTAAAEGGALWNGNATMRVDRSSFEDNAAPNGGALFNNGNFLNVLNSTVADTDAGGTNPVIENAGVQTTLQFVTVSSTDTGSATTLVNSNPAQPAYGSFTVGNSLLVASCDTEISSAGDNVTTESDCLFAGGAGSDQQGVDPMVSALTSTQGGPTAGAPGATAVAKVHQLMPGSPAIDEATSGNISFGGSGSEPAPTVDQRGETRPADGDETGGPGNDAGAFELIP